MISHSVSSKNNEFVIIITDISMIIYIRPSDKLAYVSKHGDKDIHYICDSDFSAIRTFNDEIIEKINKIANMCKCDNYDKDELITHLTDLVDYRDWTFNSIYDTGLLD